LDKQLLFCNSKIIAFYVSFIIYSLAIVLSIHILSVPTFVNIVGIRPMTPEAISSTVNVRIFCTNVIFLLTFWLCWKIRTKNSYVKRWWNWHLRQFRVMKQFRSKSDWDCLAHSRTADHQNRPKVNIIFGILIVISRNNSLMKIWYSIFVYWLKIKLHFLRISYNLYLSHQTLLWNYFLRKKAQLSQ